jgi:predicted glycogen debranching enzyme
MDAIIFNEPATPRYGKPVEINALFYNSLYYALTIIEEQKMDGLSFNRFFLSKAEIEKLARQLEKSLNLFFVDNIWCDRIDGMPVKEIRPNYIIALSLPFDFTKKEKIAAGLKLAEEKLLTPFGLKSLSKESPHYKNKYTGTQTMRDNAYHQGTVWTWLLSCYSKVLKKAVPDKNELRQKLESIINPLRLKIKKGEYASVAEVWDAENPSSPKGTPAQAWSVSALYLIEKMIGEIQ